MASEPLEVERLDRGVLSFRGPLTMENVTPFLNAVRREERSDHDSGFHRTCLIWILPGWDRWSAPALRAPRPDAASRSPGSTSACMKVFEITKVEQVFLMFPTLSDAIEAFTNAGTA